MCLSSPGAYSKRRSLLCRLRFGLGEVTAVGCLAEGREGMGRPRGTLTCPVKAMYEVEDHEQ